MDQPDQPRVPKSEVYDAFAASMKALGSGRRLQLLELLSQGEHSVDMLARMTESQVTTVSANLQVLKRANLVVSRREGTTMFYRLAGDDVARLYLVARDVVTRRSPELREVLSGFLAEAGDEPVVHLPVLRAQDLTVVDLRAPNEFEAGHIDGAVSIPYRELRDRVGELDPDRPTVIYCRGEFCRHAREGAAWLRESGFDAVALDEGYLEWKLEQAAP